MDYNTTISTMLNGELIVDINKLFHIRIWRYYFYVYSPLQIQIRRTKTFFPLLNFYSVNHHWQKPFWFWYQNPKVEKIIESSN